MAVRILEALKIQKIVQVHWVKFKSQKNEAMKIAFHRL